MADEIGFTFCVEPRGADNGTRVPVALVSLLVNGVEPLDSRHERPFDAFELLVRQATPGDFNPYTCSCGVPGCAGLHDEWVLGVSGDVISWDAPSIGNDPAKTHVFRRDQYLLALNILEEQLCEAQRTHAGLQFSPFDGRLSQDGWELSAQLTSARQRFSEHEARERAYRHGLGPLEKQHVLLQTETLDMLLYPRGLYAVLFPDEGTADLAGELSRWSRVAAVMRGDLHAALSAVEWPALEAVLWVARAPGQPLLEVPTEMPVDFWNNVQLRLSRNPHE